MPLKLELGPDGKAFAVDPATGEKVKELAPEDVVGIEDGTLIELSDETPVDTSKASTEEPAEEPEPEGTADVGGKKMVPLAALKEARGKLRTARQELESLTERVTRLEAEGQTGAAFTPASMPEVEPFADISDDDYLQGAQVKAGFKKYHEATRLNRQLRDFDISCQLAELRDRPEGSISFDDARGVVTRFLQTPQGIPYAKQIFDAANPGEAVYILGSKLLEGGKGQALGEPKTASANPAQVARATRTKGQAATTQRLGGARSHVPGSGQGVVKPAGVNPIIGKTGTELQLTLDALRKKHPVEVVDNWLLELES